MERNAIDNQKKISDTFSFTSSTSSVNNANTSNITPRHSETGII